jgi:hypothetical protein
MKRIQVLLALTLLLPLAALGQTGTAKTAHDLSVPPNCTAASGSGTAYTCATAPSFVPAAGDHIQFKGDVANTAAATLAVNGASAASIKKWGGGTALIANDILAGHWISATYDGTNWQLEGQLGNAPALTGTLISVRTFTSGSAATYTPTSGTTAIKVELLGCGGGGGGTTYTSASDSAWGGGGAASAYVRYFVSGINAGTQTGMYTVCSTGGTAGTTSAGTGGTGGNTTFVWNGGSTVTATGGLGGVGMAYGLTVGTMAAGGAGQTGTNGTINGSGNPGSNGWRSAATTGVSGSGGSTYWGGGGVGKTANGAGNSATGYGAGGGGGASTSAAVAGGSGGVGILIIEEYR